MKINRVKTCFKIADVVIERSDILKFNYLKDLKDENGISLNQNILKENVGRVYLICVNSEIKKIGGSEDAGGMKGTLNIYRDGGLNGQPSPRSIGTWWHLFHELSKNNHVEIYMIYQNSFFGKVKGLFGSTPRQVSISYKHIENACLADYFSVEKKNPDWNYQENSNVWTQEIEELHKITLFNKGKKGQEKNLDFAKTLKNNGIKTIIKRCRKDYDR